MLAFVGFQPAGITAVSELADWALPIQERHLADVLRRSLELAGRQDPNAVE